MQYVFCEDELEGRASESLVESRIEHETAALLNISCIISATGNDRFESSKILMAAFKASGPSLDWFSMPPGKCLAITSAKCKSAYICSTG